MKLNINNVKTTFVYCLYDDADLVEGKLRDGVPPPIMVESVMLRIGFNSAKVAEQKHNIKAMLEDLSLDFSPESAGGGGGASFLQLCMTRDGEHWGEHCSCDELVALALAAGFCTFPLSRAMWHRLPGRMPYICVDTSDTPVPVAVSAPL